MLTKEFGSCMFVFPDQPIMRKSCYLPSPTFTFLQYTVPISFIISDANASIEQILPGVLSDIDSEI